MLDIGQYARAVVPRGTLAVVTDLHELANVCGLDGLRYIINSARRLPLELLILAPSCVPASHLETSGASLGPPAIRRILRWRGVIGLGEVMNFPGVIDGDDSVLAKITLAGDRVIDGYAPGVSGKKLNAYTAAGISSDHESVSLEEALDILHYQLIVPAKQKFADVSGFRIALSGTADAFTKTRQALQTGFVLAIAITFLLLVILFEDLLSPFVIMAMLPIAGAGGLAVRSLPRRRRWVALVIVSVVVPALVWSYMRPREWTAYGDDGLRQRVARHWVTTAQLNEYLPRWAEWFNPGVRTFVGPSPGSARVVAGAGEVAPGAPRRFAVRAATAVTVGWAQFYFPGWWAKVDGEWVEVRPDAMGLVAINLPAGEHDVEFVFVDTPVRRWAKCVSGVAIAVLAGVLVIPAFKRRRRAEELSGSGSG